MSEVISLKEFAQITASPMLAEGYSVASGNNYLVVDTDDDSTLVEASFLPACVVLGLGTPNAQHAVDTMAANEAELAELIDAIEAQPTAAATLVQVVRHNQSSSIEQGLLAESLAYSTLQQSSGFNRWLGGFERPASPTQTEPPLLVEREGANLILTLNRPAVHNAYNADLKDLLCEALQLAHSDHSIERVSLRGKGASFGAGGDLSEFGFVEDAGLAHLSRTTRSAGALLATLPCASDARVHGACIGAGIELPAFAQRISAHPDAFFQLPEVAMGLIPGAGGTVSILHRIGRQRTNFMALSNRRVDASTALSWGLVDALLS